MADQQNQTGEPPADNAPHPADRKPVAVQQYQPQSSGMGQSAGTSSVSLRNESAASMMAAREAKAVEVRALMAERHPRSVEKFRDGVLAACKRAGFADMAMYAKPIGGKDVTGLSIRFAEEAIRHWKNAEVSVSIVAEDDESRTLEAVASDYENNIHYRVQARVSKFVWRLSPKQGEEVHGQKVNSNGRQTYLVRADEDALFTAERAAAAKAMREVTLKLMPSDILEECESQIDKTLEALGGDPAKFLVRLLGKFEKVGVVREQLERLTGKDLGVLNIAELKRLDRIHNAISQNETDWETVMAESAKKKAAPAAEAKTEGAQADPKSAADKLRGAAAPKKSAEAPAAETPAAPAKAETKAEPKAEAKAPAKAPAKGPDLKLESQGEGPAIALKDCVDCGALKGQPHETECPLA
jgi:hypothetical protein